MISRKINTALLSYGMSGEVFHGPLLEAHRGFYITAVLQRDSQKGSKHTYTVVNTLDEILKDPAIELVIVNTPNETHFTYTKAVLEAGKHAIVEKPFTVDVKEASELIALAKKKNKTLTVFQNRRWDGDFLTV